jgi:hypothetical protein
MDTNKLKNTFYDVETIPERAEVNKLNELRNKVKEVKASHERTQEIARLSNELKSYEPPTKTQKFAGAVKSGLTQTFSYLKKVKEEKEKRNGLSVATIQKNQKKTLTRVQEVKALSPQEKSSAFISRFK